MPVMADVMTTMNKNTNIKFIYLIALMVLLFSSCAQQKRKTHIICSSGEIEEKLTINTNPRFSKSKLSKTEIAMVFKCNQGFIFSLYNKQLRKDKNFSGKLVLTFDVKPSGKVNNINIVSDDIKDQMFFKKMKTLINKFNFPKKTEETKNVSYPITFIPS